MLENLVKKFNGVYLESAYVIPEYTIEEVKEELGQYGIEIDENKEEGASIVNDKVFVYNISEEGTSVMFYCEVMDKDEYLEAYEEIVSFEDDDDIEE